MKIVLYKTYWNGHGYNQVRFFFSPSVKVTVVEQDVVIEMKYIMYFVELTL